MSNQPAMPCIIAVNHGTMYDSERESVCVCERERVYTYRHIYMHATCVLLEKANTATNQLTTILMIKRTRY
jgi:hypothetical protein